MKRSIIIFSCLLIICHAIDAQESDIIQDNISRNLLKQLAYYPQEKIHLHLDRDIYVPGEKIWFKAYLVDASTHLYPTFSRYIYVELISPDSLINRVMIRPENDIYHGHITLNEMLPEGYYTIRVYTKYMENLGDDYFFKKNIRIGKIEIEEEISKSKTKRNKKAEKTKEDYDVSFFPEGGYLLDKTLCNVGFKALNNYGLSESISGDIVDEEGNKLIPIHTFHAGMGRFAIVPEKEKTYYLECENTQGIAKKFELPKINPEAHSLACNWRNDKLFITQKKSKETPERPSYLLMHCRGNILYYKPWDHKKEYILFNKKDLPTGLIQIVLFDNQNNPLSERLIFCKKEEPVNVDFQTDKTSYETRDLVTSLISITDTVGMPYISDISISVTDDKDIAVNESFTIISNLLLSSEIKGYIEEPGYYFMNDNKNTEMALDNLMLTQGWRRYNIPEVIKGNFETPEKSFETSQSISGIIKGGLLLKPVTNGQVSILAKEGDFGFTETDDNGRFSFIDFEYPDSTTYYIQSLSKKGRQNVIMEIDELQYPEPRHLPNTPNYLDINKNTIIKEATDNSGFIEKATQRSKYDENMRIVHLKNVEVVAAKIKKEEKHLPWFTSGSDATIHSKDFEKRTPMFVKDMLWGVAGVRVYNTGNISIRGGSFPLVLIDGIPIYFDGNILSPFDSPLERVNVQDVERIDVFKGASAAMFGSNGGNGAISIVTKRGNGEISPREEYNQTVLSPLGYQKPVEFYSPKYDNPETRYLGNPDYRTTIFWKPDITTTKDGKASFEFYTSDFPTTYSVVIEGLTEDGKIIRKTEKIKVE